MKNIIMIITIIILSFEIKAQVARPNPVSVLLTDYAVQSDDTAYVFVFTGRETSEGGIVDAQIVLDSIDCNNSWWMVGETNLKDQAPAWILSAGDLSFPLTIDTTAVNAASQIKFRPLPYDNSWTFLIKWQWNSQYMVFATYKGGCTKGTATLSY